MKTHLLLAVIAVVFLGTSEIVSAESGWKNKEKRKAFKAEMKKLRKTDPEAYKAKMEKLKEKMKAKRDAHLAKIKEKDPEAYEAKVKQIKELEELRKTDKEAYKRILQGLI